MSCVSNVFVVDGNLLILIYIIYLLAGEPAIVCDNNECDVSNVRKVSEKFAVNYDENSSTQVDSIVELTQNDDVDDCCDDETSSGYVTPDLHCSGCNDIDYGE